jgi:Ca2+/Na+ antiporter
MDLQRAIGVAIAALMIVGGSWAILSPRRFLESIYRWDRRWTRVFTLGLMNPTPRELTDRALKATSILGAIFLLIGVVLMFFLLRSLP